MVRQLSQDAKASRGPLISAELLGSRSSKEPARARATGGRSYQDKRQIVNYVSEKTSMIQEKHLPKCVEEQRFRASQRGPKEDLLGQGEKGGARSTATSKSLSLHFGAGWSRVRGS